MGLFNKLFHKEMKSANKKGSLAANATENKIDVRENRVKNISCSECDGHYIVREGKYGIFGGCSNYPTCRSTINLPELVLRFVEKYGINIYRWERKCYKCGKVTPVYSYYLSYELEELDEIFSMSGPTVGLGDISHVDYLLSTIIPSIKKCFSHTTQSSYIANTCIHCGALQGRNYVVDDPHEIIGELWHEHGMEKYLYKTIPIDNSGVLLSDIRLIYSRDRT